MHIPMCFYIVGMHLYNHYAGQGLQHLSYSMRPPCVSSKIIVTTTTLTLKDSLLISVIEELCRSRNLQTSITLNHLLHSSLCVVSSEVSPSLCVTSALFFICVAVYCQRNTVGITMLLPNVLNRHLSYL